MAQDVVCFASVPDKEMFDKVIVKVSLHTAICSLAKQNDRPHESYLAQGMAKILLFNFVLLPNF